MKSFLLFLAFMVVCLAEPAYACRVRTAPDVPEIPPAADLVVFTATIDQRWDNLGRPGADLRVRSELVGEPGSRVDATWTGLRWSMLTMEGEAPQAFPMNSCAGQSIYHDTLRSAPMGAEVAVMARRTPTGIDVQDLALVGSAKGREILGLASR